MASVANLTVDLNANVARLSKDLQSAESRFNKTSSTFKSTAKTIGVAMVAAFSVNAIDAFINKNLNAIDELAKFSDQIGISTESLAGLYHQGELTGVSQEKMRTSLEKMVKSLGEAASGTGEAKRYLESMGLSVQGLIRLSPDEAFAEIADKINDMATQSEKAAAVASIFGRSGGALINTMKGGKDAIAAARAEVEEYGTAISRIDAKKVEDANDSLTRTKAMLSGIGTQLTVALAEPIENAATALRDVVSLFGEMKSALDEIAAGPSGMVLFAMSGIDPEETARGVQQAMDVYKQSSSTAGQADVSGLAAAEAARNASVAETMGGSGGGAGLGSEAGIVDPSMFSLLSGGIGAGEGGYSLMGGESDTGLLPQHQTILDSAGLLIGELTSIESDIFSMQAESAARLTDLDAQLSDARMANAAKEAQTRAGLYTNMMNLMAFAASTGNKKLFAVTKAFAIPMAVMDTLAGMNKALAQGGFYGIAMAAAVGALGFANVASMASASPGQSSASASIAGSSAATASNTSYSSDYESSTETTGATKQGATVNLTINTGATVLDESTMYALVEKLSPSIEKAVGDGKLQLAMAS